MGKGKAQRQGLSTCRAAKVLRNDTNWALVIQQKLLETTPIDVSVAWGQGNNVDMRHFFHRSHLREATAKKGFSFFSIF